MVCVELSHHYLQFEYQRNYHEKKYEEKCEKFFDEILCVGIFYEFLCPFNAYFCQLTIFHDLFLTPNFRHIETSSLKSRFNAFI